MNDYTYGNYAPWYLYKKIIKTIRIEEGVTTIGNYAFRSLGKLTTVYIPSTITSIGDYAFLDAADGVIIIYNGTQAEWNAIAKGAGWDSGLDEYTIKFVDVSEHTPSEWIVDSAATCEEDGIRHIECTECGRHLFSEFIPALGHNYGEWAIDIIPTVDSEGTIVRICANDHAHVETYNLPVLSNENYVYELATAPTCELPGLEQYTFEYDGYTFVISREVDALGHYVAVGGKETVDSVNTSNSGFVNSNGEYSSTNKSHNSTSQFTMTVLYNCTIVIEYKVSSESGWDKLIIEKNGSTLDTISGSVSWRTKTITLSAGDVLRIKYTKDGSVSNGDDTGYFKIVSGTQVEIDTTVIVPADGVEATCTHAVVCNSCGETIKEALGHTLTDWIVDTEATAEVPGAKHKECNTCGETIETSIIPTSEHNYTSVVTDPTCTNQGYTTHTCEHCGDVYVDNYVPAYDHEFEISESQDATCTENGYIAYVCTHNNTHTYTETIEASGHDYNWSVSIAPTASATGSLVGVCSHNENHTNTFVLPVLDEINYSYAIIAEPTCLVNGIGRYTAEFCGITVSFDISIAAHGHSYGDWVVLINPTETTNGLLSRVCQNNIEHAEIYVLPAFNVIDYTYSVITNPVCETDGLGRYTKMLGEQVFSFDCPIAKLGHDYIHHNAEDATCTEIGWNEHETCSRCDYSTYEEIAALGHNYGEWIEAVAETCTTDGYVDHYNCSRCNQNFDVDYNELETIVVPAHGHLVETGGKETVDSITSSTNGTNNGFVYSNGIWTSTNQNKDGTTDTFTITVLYDCTLVIEYKVASEQNYDKLIILKNGSTLDTISGSVSWKSVSINVLAGDTVVIKYSKDGSVSNNGDTAYFKIVSGNQVEIDSTVLAPAEDFDATCTNPVTCDICGVIVKNTIPHNPGEWIIDVEATYEQDGSKHKECTECGITVETSIIPMLTHSYTSIVTAPTCTEQGFTTHTCSECGDVYVDDYIPAPGHSYGEWAQTTAPGCETKGEERRDCVNCDHYETKEIAALGHNYGEWIAEVPATCEGEGTLGHYHCVTCGKNFDAEKNELTTIVIPALGHTESDWIVDEEATCTEDGSKHKECTVCEKVLATETIEKLGHDKVQHPAQAETCTEHGWNAYETCKRDGCDYTTYDEIPAKGHTYGEWTQTVAPGCETKGEERRDCVDCDHYETKEVDALGHDKEQHSAKAPTCTEIGWNAYETCKRDGCDYTTYEEIPAPGHSYGEWAQTTAPGCETKGEERRDCVNCDHYETKEIAALGHNYGEWIAEVPATCEGEGTLGHYHCVTCGKNFDAEKNELTTIVIPALGHTESDWIVDEEATCTEDGSKHKECTVCEKVLATETIEKLGHDKVQHPAQAETCTEHGWNAYETCKRDGCDYTTYDEIPAKGHTYGEWTQTVAPGCETKGEERRDCEDCDHYETREVVALGHNKVQHTAKDATCTEIGWSAYETCTRCDYTTYVEIPANGHSYGDWVETTAPTCTAKGEERRDCEDCDHYETREVAALGHNKVQHEAKAPTCTAIGWNAYETCTRCDYTTYVEIPANGHSYGDWTETTAPTCTAKGEERRDCEDCDHYETREVAALGHTYGTWIDEVPATCECEGTLGHYHCSACGKDFDTNKNVLNSLVIPATGHIYGNWTQTVAPTCTAKGEERRDCEDCDHYEMRELAILEHNDTNNDNQCDICEKVLSTNTNNDDNENTSTTVIIIISSVGGIGVIGGALWFFLKKRKIW